MAKSLRPVAPGEYTPAGLTGLPDATREQRGFSSLEMELRYGGGDVQRRILAANPLERLSSAFPWAEFGRKLRQQFSDLPRHFIFEYYPWYHNDPFRHWQQWDRVPPDDLAATSVPKLGAYSSRDTAVIEQHARWIKEVGAGAVNLSWWGADSFPAKAAHSVMDVMADHDIKVMFHIEPYRNDRASRYRDDITYLIQEYGDKRSWDAFLLLRDARGRIGPVFKSFRTIVAKQVTDCHGVVHDVPDYTPDEDWKRQTDSVRERFANDFDQVTMLADSLNMNRTRKSGFDGIAVYNNFLDPSTWQGHSERANSDGLVYSFNTNPGFDSIARRTVPPDSCYVPEPFHPPAEMDWNTSDAREHARSLSRRQIRRTLSTSIDVQSNPLHTNSRRGFFLVFLNSFNEWHEGHAFEPAKNYARLTSSELPSGYHNARRGSYRLKTLGRYLRRIVNA
ncbi:MAG TPA: hypothetical protein QGG47_03335 [Acidobacteriota bacterium]|nr:hypothetical protein [Acidobacteriota bacterium]